MPWTVLVRVLNQLAAENEAFHQQLKLPRPNVVPSGRNACLTISCD